MELLVCYAAEFLSSECPGGMKNLFHRFYPTWNFSKSVWNFIDQALSPPGSTREVGVWVEGNQVKTVMILSAHFHAGTLYWVLSPMLGWAFFDFASSAAGSASFLLLKYHRYWCIYIYTDTFNISHLCSMVYKSVCQQHSEQMYRSLLELVSSFLRDVAVELQVQ